MALTPPPPAPNRGTIGSVFSAAVDLFLAWIITFVAELNVLVSQLNNISTTSTSTTSVLIGTGTKNFTVATGKSYFTGQSLKIANSATAYMVGEVISYNSGTGALSVNVVAIVGSGTFASWTITLGFNSTIGNEQLNNLYINDLITVTFVPDSDFVAISDTSAAGGKAKALIPSATDTVAGLAERLTAAEYITGTDTTRFLSAAVARANNSVAGTLTTLSGTATTIPNIPAWVKRLTIVGTSVSTDGASPYIIQIGDAGGIETTSYDSAAGQIDGTNATTLTSPTNGYGITTGAISAASAVNFVAVLYLVNPATNTWILSGGGNGRIFTGVKSLSAILTQFNITTVGGANTFDGGSIQYFME